MREKQIVIRIPNWPRRRWLLVIGLVVLALGAAARAFNPFTLTDPVAGTPVSSSDIKANYQAIRDKITELQNAITVENWQPASLLNGWKAYGAVDGWSAAAFYKDPFGVVHFKGLVDGKTATNQLMFNLPVGYRPDENLVVAAHGLNGSATLTPCSLYITGKQIGANASNALGDVQTGCSGYSWVSFDSITFRAAQ
jgi:hypothetical protein